MIVKPYHKKILERIFHGLSWRLPSWLFHYDHTFLVKGRELRLQPREYREYRLRCATADDIAILKREGVKEALFRERIERGDHCILVLKGERAVAWSWSATGRLFVASGGIEIDTGEDGFFLYNVYTAPEERLKGFILGCFKMQLAHNHGRMRHNAFGTISAFNTESLRTHFRMGFRICGETIGVAVAGINVCYYRSWPFPTRRLHVFCRLPAGDIKTV